MKRLNKARQVMDQAEYLLWKNSHKPKFGEALADLAGHEKDLAELSKLCAHAITVYRAHGYNIAADHMSEVLSRFEVRK